MSEDKKYNYSVSDIERYHKGLLSPAEMHEMEKAALDDPFFADALEGYMNASSSIPSDLAELNSRLQAKLQPGKLVRIEDRKTGFRWWKIAAAGIVLGLVGLLTYRVVNTGKKEFSIATTTNKEEAPAIFKTDSTATIKKHSINLSDSVNSYAISKIPANAAKSSTTDKKSVSKETDTVQASGVAAQPITTGVATTVKTQDQKLSTEYERPIAKARNADDEVKKEKLGYYDRYSLSRNKQTVNYFRGRVTDNSNNPLPFTNITNTSDGVGTYADAQGNFTLISPDTALKVTAHSVGFENALIDLHSDVANNKVILQESNSVAANVIGHYRPDSNLAEKNSLKFEEPEPADGWMGYSTYMANNLNVPRDSNLQVDKGEVQLSFGVNSRGEPVDIKVEKSLCQKCDEEAIRLVKEGPKWKKKTRKTKRVNLSIPFDTDK